ncbi:MAG: ABC transporter substrate-binding protein [Deltaproteobacteria bacterium]|nr:ABC transporter substrate-binding protein [Deltaproteobacteria bacterium]
MRLVYPKQPKSLDPQVFPPDPAAWPIIMTSYRRIFDLKPGTTELDNLNSSAVTYRVSDDGLIYTITLREGRTFTDGSPVDSRAALYTFDRLMAGQCGQTYFPYLKFIEIVGPYTFRLILSQPWPPFLASLTTPMASLISPGLEKRGTGFLDHQTLGSGRFVVDEFKPGLISLKLRIDLASIPRLDRVEFIYDPDDRSRFERVAQGEAHLAWGVSAPADYSGPAKTILAPSFETRFLAFNMTRPYNKMIGTREALANLARVTLSPNDPLGRPSSVFPNGLAPRSALNESFEPATLEKRAAELLSQIGPSRIPLDLVFQANDELGLKDAEKLAEKLSTYHIPVRLVPLNGAHGRALLEKADWDLMIDFRRPDLPSPEMWLGRFLDSRSSVSGNPARFENQEANDYIVEMEVISSADRAISLRRLAMLATQEKPYVMLYQKLIPMVVDQRLAALRPHPMWVEVWPIEETNLDPFKASPTVEVQVKPPPVRDFDHPVAEPYE